MNRNDAALRGIEDGRTHLCTGGEHDGIGLEREDGIGRRALAEPELDAELLGASALPLGHSQNLAASRQARLEPELTAHLLVGPEQRHPMAARRRDPRRLESRRAGARDDDLSASRRR